MLELLAQEVKNKNFQPVLFLSPSSELLRSRAAILPRKKRGEYIEYIEYKMFSGGTLHSHSYFEQDQYDFLGDEGKESMKRYGSPTERMIASYYGDDDDDEITSFFPSGEYLGLKVIPGKSPRIFCKPVFKSSRKILGIVLL